MAALCLSYLLQLSSAYVRRFTLALIACAVFFASANASEGIAASLLRSYPDVIGEYLQIPGAGIRSTPDDFNTISFLRLRTVLDAERPKPAHAVLIAIPDIHTSAAYWLPLSAQLIRKALAFQCNDSRVASQCRAEVWVMLPRSANLIDSRGVRLARAEHTPISAIDYYFDRKVLSLDPQRPGRWPLVPKQQLLRESHWRPLLQLDVPFMAEWGFETQAADLEKLIAYVGQRHLGKNVFLAGLGHGADFALGYAAKKQTSGKRGFESIAGLVLLNNDGHAATQQSPTPTQIGEYFDRISKLRKGQRPVFTDEDNPALLPLGPIAAASQAVAHSYYALAQPNIESIFAAPNVGHSPLSPQVDEFLASLRLTLLAHAGMSIDTNPLPMLASLQAKPINHLGANIGRLEFSAVNATCSQPTASCMPVLSHVERSQLLRWQNADNINTQLNTQTAASVGTALLWLHSLGFSPARSNIQPLTHTFRASGKKTWDASALTANDWYPSERYAADIKFLRAFKTAKIHDRNVDIDLDRSAIVNLPVYAASSDRNAMPQYSLPLVNDYTHINHNGTFQTQAARSIQPLDQSINSQHYSHADFTSADDSIAKQKPGEPGSSLVSNTLIEWMLKRSDRAADVPSPAKLGVVSLY
jgi:hypothetical protein